MEREHGGDSELVEPGPLKNILSVALLFKCTVRYKGPGILKQAGNLHVPVRESNGGLPARKT